MLADRCVTYSYPTQGSWRGFGPNNTTCRVSLVQLSFNAAYFKRTIKTPLSFASFVIWQAPFKCFLKSDILSFHITITAEQKLWMENTEENAQGRFLLSFNPSFSVSAAHWHHESHIRQSLVVPAQLTCPSHAASGLCKLTHLISLCLTEKKQEVV